MCVGRVLQESDLSNIEIDQNRPLKLVESSLNSQENYRQEKSLQESDAKTIQEDILAVLTYYTKVVLFGIGDAQTAFFRSPLYRILLYTTQPAHLITAFSVIIIAFLMIPTKAQVSVISPVWTLVYLGSFSAHFGAQIWMTFISGLALYFSLPRHTFGSVQQVLFPKYFLFNAGLSLTNLAIFLRVKNGELMHLEIAIQAAAMSACFLIELIIRLYLAPPLLVLITEKNKIERQAGVGMEIGKLEIGSSLLNCPHYLRLHHSFRKVHMTIAILNMVTMACTMLHLHYLSHQLCIRAL